MIMLFNHKNLAGSDFVFSHGDHGLVDVRSIADENLDDDTQYRSLKDLVRLQRELVIQDAMVYLIDQDLSNVNVNVLTELKEELEKFESARKRQIGDNNK